MNKYIEQLNPWKSLVCYECEDPNTGNRRIIQIHDPGGYVEFTNGSSGDIHNLTAPHDMTSKQWRVLSVQRNIIEIKRVENPLIEEAKKRYPPGTKFQPAHISGITLSELCIVGPNETFYLLLNTIYLSHGNQEKNGHNYSEFVYHDGSWAEIVTDLKEEPKKYQSKETIKSFIKEFQAVVKGETTTVQAEKTLRSAKSALQVQISNMEGDLITYEDAVETAKKGLKLARVNNGKVIESRGMYVTNLILAKNSLNQAEEELKDHHEVLEFLRSEITKLDFTEEITIQD